jgi:signal transduction histidine kinase
MRDVSERKAAELEMQAARTAAEAANKAKSNFLANMSHELRTPLNAVIGFTDVMCHETFGPIENPRYREYVSLIHNSGQYLLDLINDILDMAKIESGKFELNLKDFDLAETIGECIQTMAERAASAGVGVNASLPARNLVCRADSRAMKQILLNLLSNAIKFTPPGGHVNVTATMEGDVVRIEIRDDGIGIAAADLPRLAKPFVQVCDNPNLAKKGTGLGLALVRALIEQHGGHLTIESPAQEGTIVTVEFPRFATGSKAAA